MERILKLKSLLRLLGPTLLIVSVGGGIMLSLIGARPKPNTISTDVLPPIPSVDSPEVKDALARAQSVLDTILEQRWTYGRPPVHWRELTLPGQRNAENPYDRDPRVTAFRLPLRADAYDPDMAFFADTYVRRNSRHLAGEHTSASPEGFYIVAYRDGRVMTVPAEDARLVPMPSNPKEPGVKRCRMAFPGMKRYDDPEAKPAIPLSD